jgi:hypothetical protein
MSARDTLRQRRKGAAQGSDASLSEPLLGASSSEALLDDDAGGAGGPAAGGGGGVFELICNLLLTLCVNMGLCTRPPLPLSEVSLNPKPETLYPKPRVP